MDQNKENGHYPITDTSTMGKADPLISGQENLSSDQQLSTALQDFSHDMTRSRYAETCSDSSTDSGSLEQVNVDFSPTRRFLSSSQRCNLTSEQRTHPSGLDVLKHSDSGNSNVKPFPRLWGEARKDIEIEFPTKLFRLREPLKAKGPDHDLRECYSDILTPSDVKNMTAAQVICTLFSHHPCYSLQETYSWLEAAKTYAQDLPESLQRGPYRPAIRPDIKSRSKVLEEMKNRALENIIHHDDFYDIKVALTKGSAKNVQGDIKPALLVHNGISFLSGVREKEDHSFENLTERLWRLTQENLERRTKKLHDLEVIFDTEVIYGDNFHENENVQVIERETNATDYKSSPEMATLNKFAETLWAIAKIDLQQDGSKAYEIKKPGKEQPACSIPEKTHRHFVVFADLFEDLQVETKETNYEDQPKVSAVARDTLQTLWAVVKINLLDDGTKVYEIKAPSTEKPSCAIPEATHRHFFVSPPREIFNQF